MKEKLPIIIMASISCCLIIITALLFIQPTEFWAVEYETSFASAFVTIIFILTFVYAMAKNKWISHLPEFSTKATIIAKNVIIKNEWDSIYERYENKTYYKITFETENRIQWTFDMSLDLFNAYLENDKGTLYYKQSKKNKIYYVNFLRER